jgi:hypothetical protein
LDKALGSAFFILHPILDRALQLVLGTLESKVARIPGIQWHPSGVIHCAMSTSFHIRLVNPITHNTIVIAYNQTALSNTLPWVSATARDVNSPQLPLSVMLWNLCLSQDDW